MENVILPFALLRVRMTIGKFGQNDDPKVIG